MPGHILTAKCACDFGQRVSPGATFSEGRVERRVIAYTADGRGLATIESGEAARGKLTVIEDPALADPLSREQRVMGALQLPEVREREHEALLGIGISSIRGRAPERQDFRLERRNVFVLPILQ